MKIDVEGDEQSVKFEKSESKRNSMEIHTSEEEESSKSSHVSLKSSESGSKKKKKNINRVKKSTTHSESVRRTPSLSLGTEIEKKAANIGVTTDQVSESVINGETTSTDATTIQQSWTGSNEDTTMQFPVPGESWSTNKPKPRTGYSCKICGKAGGEPDSHWFQLCPKASQNAKHFQPPKHGYVCKLCGKRGGEIDSHWFQQCPSRLNDYAKSQLGNNSIGNMMHPYGEFPMMYAHPGQMYFMPAPVQQQQQVSSPSSHVSTPVQGHPSPLIGPSPIQATTLATPNWFAANPYMYAPGSPSHQGHVVEHNFSTEMDLQRMQQQQQQQMLQFHFQNMSLQQHFVSSPKAHQ